MRAQPESDEQFRARIVREMPFNFDDAYRRALMEASGSRLDELAERLAGLKRGVQIVEG